MKACGEMHAGGYTGFVESCAWCRQKNRLPAIKVMDTNYDNLKALLREAGEVAKLAEWEWIEGSRGVCTVCRQAPHKEDCRLAALLTKIRDTVGEGE